MSKPPRSPFSGANPARTPLEAMRNDGLAPLVARARWLDELDLSLRRCLPPALAPHCRLANVTQDKLVFQVNSPVWHRKLRLHADALLGAATAAGLSARTLVVKVVADAPMSPGNTGKPLSQAVRETLRTTAQSVEDPDLRAQLLMLAGQP